MMSSAPNPAAENAALRAALAEERAARTRAEAEIEHLKLQIAKLRRERYGQSSERGRHLLDQLELQLEEMETAAGENASQGEADDGDTTVRAFTRRKPKRAPLPADLPRERVVLPSPEACSCCGGGDLVKLGEDVTETLEVVPRQWKVVQTVREKFSCRACEAITQPPAPHHAIPRGRAGPSLLAMIVCDKFAMHLPLTRQSRAFAAEGIALDVSTLADWVGRACATLAPLQERIRAHVLGAERLHGDDTTVPVLARKKTVTGRIWTYVRDDRPFGGSDPPAALFHYSRDRGGKHPRGHLAEWSGILQADAYAGFNALYVKGRVPAPITEASCWAHGGAKFFELANLAKAMRAPMAIEAVRRIDEIFAIERELNGEPAERRRIVRQARVRPLVKGLERWMRAERSKLSSGSAVAKAMDYMVKRWTTFSAFLDDGRICLTNNAAERALRGIAVGRRNWTFAGSDRGADRAAALYTLIETARLNDVDPRAWLADVLARINDHPAKAIDDLLPWNWKAGNQADMYGPFPDGKDFLAWYR